MARRFFLKPSLFLILCLGIMPVGTGWTAASPPADLTRLGLEELMNLSVQGASKYEQSVLDAPSAVSIVTRNDIQKFGYRTLADILRSVRGFFVTNDRNYEYVGVRGFNRPGDYSTRVLLLVDGHRLNDGMYDQAPIGTDFPLDVDLIERVEVIRGPSSSIYGANAFFAVINVITRSGRDVRGAEVSGEGGSFYTYKGRLSYGNTWVNGPEVLVSGSYYNSRGPGLFFREFNSPATHNGFASGCDYDRSGQSFAKASFQDLTLTGLISSREKGIPTGAFGTRFGDSRTRTVDTRAYIDVKYDHAFPGDWRVLTRLSYDHSPYDGFYYLLLTPANPFLTYLNRDKSRNDWWSAELQVTKRLFERHKLSMGGEYRDYFRMDQKNYDAAPFTSYLDDKRELQVAAYYLQDEITILKNLRLHGGFRYDHYTTYGGSLNPRVALIYHPIATGALKLLYGQAFRAPNAYELYYQDGGVTAKANPKLSPEKIYTYEVVWEQFLGKHYHLAASGYFYHIDDLITQQIDPDGLLVFRNTDKVDAKGLEFEVGGKWANGWEVRLSYALQEAKNAQTGKLLSNSPAHLPKFNLIAPVYRDKLFSGLEVQYLSPRKTLDNRHVGDAALVNFTLFNRNVVKGLEFSASVYNLLNQKYGDPGAGEHLQNGMNAIIQNGITFRLKLTYNF